MISTTPKAVAIVLVLYAVIAGAQVVDRVLAIVDGRLVTLSDVRVTTTLGLTPVVEGKDAVASALDRWIERLLVLQEVDRFAPPEPDEAALSARVSEVLAQLGTAEAVTQRLAALGVDAEWVRQWVRDDLRIQSYTDQRFAGSLAPTGEEIENYFREHPTEFVRDGREMSPEAAQALARERVTANRRRALVSDWLDGLRRRATIVRPGGRGVGE
jgi:hypothetical protein